MLLSASLSLSGSQTITPSSVVNASADSTAYQSEMSVSVNPQNPLQSVAVSQHFPHSAPGNNIQIDVFYSMDGGASWDTNVIDGDDDELGVGFRFDPIITFDAEGRLFIGYICNIDVQEGATANLVVARSQDGGANFDHFEIVDSEPLPGSIVEQSPGR